ncbi:MAG: hypothetical protein APR54_04630 [Candidatus Cloacimonas sp. SDB]|nr:MAG: hypothetical protein APR54_04630 [Candidatus Cloacimonas sp. SDB]
MKYKLILFDADGTLFDFDKAEKGAFFKTMQKFGIINGLDLLHRKYDEINKSIWLDFQGKKITSDKLRIERFRRLFSLERIELPAEEISPVYLKNLAKGIDLIPDAEKIVKYFNDKCKVALATNGLSEVQRPRFAASALAEYFQHIYISEEIGFPKPEKQFFDYIFAELPYSDSAIIVGDNLSSDIAGGINSNIDTCWFNPQQINNATDIRPTYEIRDLNELKEIFQ